MIAKPVAHLLADLGVTKSHSRPHVSMTTRTQNRNSGPSSTDRTSPTASAASRTPAPTVLDSSVGTTTTTVIRASACTRRPTSTTAGPRRSETRRGVVLLDAYAEHPERFVRKTPHTAGPSGRRRGSTNRRRNPPTHQISERSVSERLTPTDLGDLRREHFYLLPQGLVLLGARPGVR